MFSIVASQEFFFYPIKYELNLYLSIWSIDGTLTGITTQGQSEPGSNSNEGYSDVPRFPEVEPHHQIQFRVIPSPTHLSWGLTIK